MHVWVFPAFHGLLVAVFTELYRNLLSQPASFMGVLTRDPLINVCTVPTLENCKVMISSFFLYYKK